MGVRLKVVMFPCSLQSPGSGWRLLPGIVFAHIQRAGVQQKAAPREEAVRRQHADVGESAAAL